MRAKFIEINQQSNSATENTAPPIITTKEEKIIPLPDFSKKKNSDNVPFNRKNLWDLNSEEKMSYLNWLNKTFKSY